MTEKMPTTSVNTDEKIDTGWIELAERDAPAAAPVVAETAPSIDVAAAARDAAAIAEVKENLRVVSAQESPAEGARELASAELGTDMAERVTQYAESRKAQEGKEKELLQQVAHKHYPASEIQAALDRGESRQTAAQSALSFLETSNAERRRQTSLRLGAVALGTAMGGIGIAVVGGTLLTTPFMLGWLGATVVGIPTVRGVQKLLDMRKEKSFRKKFSEVFGTRTA